MESYEPLKYCIEIEGLSDDDLVGLKIGIEAMEKTSERMRRATLVYLWDRYVTNAAKRQNEN